MATYLACASHKRCGDRASGSVIEYMNEWIRLQVGDRGGQ